MKQPWYIKLFLGAMLSFSCISILYAYGTEGLQVCHNNTSEQRQVIADAIDRYHNADDMWDVLRQEFVLQHYEDNPQVQEQIQWFMQHQDFLLNSANRAAPYLYYILQQVHKRNLPAELALLPIFESAYNPFAYSPAGAAGIWQMMPSTASGYGIKQNWWYDGRRDIIVSTQAALNHLAYLANFFNTNWLLALAAYDTGQGNVIIAINKNIRDGYTTDFWSLPVARETRIYVPRLLALATIIAHPEKYPVYFPPVRNAPYLAQVEVGNQMDLKKAAMFAGLTLKKLMQLNPGYNRMITGPSGSYKLVLPIENVQQFTENLQETPSYRPSIHWQRYKVKSGDTLVALAKRYNSSPSALSKINQLRSKHVRPGTNLVLPGTVASAPRPLPMPSSARLIAAAATRHVMSETPPRALSTLPPPPAPEDSLPMQSAYTSPVSSDYSIQPGDTIYMTRRGDNLQKVAAHFHVNPQDLLAANPASNARALGPDERLVIPTHLAKLSKTLKYQLTGGDTIYMVRVGDTVDKIAQRFHTTAPEIRIANLIADNDLHEGDRLVIPTHA
jgi:LysM repeat protein